jgi:hypothetical protein
MLMTGSFPHACDHRAWSHQRQPRDARTAAVGVVPEVAHVRAVVAALRINRLGTSDGPGDASPGACAAEARARLPAFLVQHCREVTPPQCRFLPEKRRLDPWPQTLGSA